MTIEAYAAHEAGGPLTPFSYDPGPLGDSEVEIDVSYCGLCHSDLSVVHNDWGNATYPVVPGHEVVGTIASVGPHVRHLEVGQTVGLGWFSSSCMTCHRCMSGDHNLCATTQSTILGRYGGFANKVRCDAGWAIPLPEGIDVAKAGPLFCGGITVFNPIVEFGVKPTDRVGVIGIGGLGHLAVQFLNKWGCEVTAFTSNPDKAKQARELGAHRIVNSRDPDDIANQRGHYDFIISTVNVHLDWSAYLATLRPKGRLHFVGASPAPLGVRVFQLLGGQKQISASPLGSPATIHDMLEFCARHNIEAMTETFGLSEVNDALAHLEAGKARYRVVLDTSR